MRTIIVEDEQPAAKRLEKLLKKHRSNYQVVAVIESVEQAVGYFESNTDVDLIFMDIQLADGLSFDIFNQINLQKPIIFTTAYDQYMLKAFKVNSIDYLLKPIDEEELEAALDKFDRLYKEKGSALFNPSIINNLIGQLSKPTFKQRFLIKIGQQIIYLPTTEIRYFFSDEGIVYAKVKNKKKYMVDYTLDQLEQALDPSEYFRVNRKFLIHIEAILKIHPFFNSRLKLDISPTTDLDVIVSRDRVSNFKKWLDS